MDSLVQIWYSIYMYKLFNTEATGFRVQGQGIVDTSLSLCETLWFDK